MRSHSPCAKKISHCWIWSQADENKIKYEGLLCDHFSIFSLLFSPKRLRRMNLLKRLRKCSFICPPPITDYYFLVCQLLCELQWRVITQRIHYVPVITLTGKIRGVHDLQKTELISWKSTLLRCHQNTTVLQKGRKYTIYLVKNTKHAFT